jgi:hypothetical protein
MPTTAEILLDRVDRRLADLGKSRYWLSMQITGGKHQGIFRDIQRRGSVPGAERLASIAERLGTTTDYLLGKVENPEQVRSEISVRELPAAWHGTPADSIPVLGTGYCEDLIVHGDDGQDVSVERLMLETDHVVRMIERPKALWAAKDAYAIYYHGSSMEPRFYQGELGIVDPRRPPSPGDFVVVQLNDGESDTVITVLVKQLERIAGGYVYLSQFKPAGTFRIERARVTRMHRICSPNELIGLV